MKYLLPTAKDMTETTGTLPHQLSTDSQHLLDQLASLSPELLAKGYAISQQAALKEAERFQQLKQTLLGTPAIELFNGLMYRQIDRTLLIDQQDFIQNHLFITSSLYGIIPATEAIAPHRLDFHNRFFIDGNSLKTYWRPHYDRWAEQANEPIVSLLSSEFETVFSRQYAEQFLKIVFHENRDGQLKTHSTISKKGRGLFINQVIQQNITQVEAIKTLQFDGFCYQEDLSTPDKLVFVRQV